MIIFFIIPFLSIWVIFELIIILYQGLYHYIKKSGKIYLEQELCDCCLNIYSNTMICLRNNSKLNGSYISKTFTSIIFPYYFSTNKNIDYGILIFSKEYYIIKNKFKELKATSKRRHLKFSDVV